MFLEITVSILLVLVIIMSVILVIIYYNYDQIGKNKIIELQEREKMIKGQEDCISKLVACEKVKENIKSILV